MISSIQQPWRGSRRKTPTGPLVVQRGAQPGDVRDGNACRLQIATQRTVLAVETCGARCRGTPRGPRAPLRSAGPRRTSATSGASAARSRTIRRMLSRSCGTASLLRRKSAMIASRPTPAASSTIATVNPVRSLPAKQCAMHRAALGQASKSPGGTASCAAGRPAKRPYSSVMYRAGGDRRRPRRRASRSSSAGSVLVRCLAVGGGEFVERQMVDRDAVGHQTRRRAARPRAPTAGRRRR